MDLEKIFRPSKWFVGFCAVLLVVWLAAKIVSNMVVAEEAKIVGKEVLTWTWEPKWWSSAAVRNANVLHRDDTTAIVEIQGEQVLTSREPGSEKLTSEKGEIRALLTFYRTNKGWELGKVEFP